MSDVRGSAVTSMPMTQTSLILPDQSEPLPPVEREEEDLDDGEVERGADPAYLPKCRSGNSSQAQG